MTTKRQHPQPAPEQQQQSPEVPFVAVRLDILAGIHQVLGGLPAGEVSRLFLVVDQMLVQHSQGRAEEAGK